MTKKHVVLLGAPGSGKGTQANLIKEGLGYFHVSTGELLRKEVASESELGRKVASIIDGGNLVDDETVLELLAKNVDVAGQKVIFDGFPRTINQAKLLDEKLLGSEEYVALYINLPVQEVVDRICLRRTCSGCGEIFNLKYRAPSDESKCDLCGASLLQRKDDNEESLKERLKIFNESNDPILGYYKEMGRLFEVDGTKNPSDVFDSVKDFVEN